MPERREGFCQCVWFLFYIYFISFSSSCRFRWITCSTLSHCSGDWDWWGGLPADSPFLSISCCSSVFCHSSILNYWLNEVISTIYNSQVQQTKADVWGVWQWVLSVMSSIVSNNLPARRVSSDSGRASGGSGQSFRVSEFQSFLWRTWNQSLFQELSPTQDIKERKCGFLRRLQGKLSTGLK